MRKIFMCFVALLAIAAAATGPARGQNSTSTLEFTGAYGTYGATADDEVVWTVTSDGAESNFNMDKGIHYGTGSAAVGYIELSTSGITGTITQVKVNASTASGVTATVSVTVGGNAFGGDAQSLSSTATDYTFTGSASGAIVVRVAKPSAATKALYVMSIEVTYTPASSGGGSGSQTVQNRTIYGIPEGWTVTANGQSVTVSGDSAIVPEGAQVILTPTAAEKPLVSNVTLEKVIRDPNEVPLTLEALTAGNIQVTMNGTLTSGMKYSVNGGAKNLITTSTTIDVTAGDKVQFYGNGTSTQAYGDSPEVKLLGTAQTKVYGNIMSLLDEDNFATLTALPNQSYVFYGLFKNNANLTDASGLLLPATTLANSCYSQMFSGCSSLTAAPVLPATTLANWCYTNMFSGCTHLNSVTCLATDISAYDCTSNWLQNVAATGTFYADPSTNWTTNSASGIPTGWTRVDPSALVPLTLEALTAGNIQVNITGNLSSGMKYSVNGGAKNLINNTTTIDVAAGDKVQFYGNGTSTQAYGYSPEVKFLGTAQTKVYGNIMSLLDEDNFATLTTLPDQPYVFRRLFSGNANLTDASGLLLPATTLAFYCYNQMFQNCSTLTAAPALPATTLANQCYRQMFQGCSNLNSVTCLATDISANQCTTNWLDGVAATGTFTTPASTNWSTGATGIPTGWTRIDPRAIVPLTMEALTDGNIKVNIDGTLSTGMKYSVNGGAKNLITTTTTIDVAAGDKVQFYGNGTSTQAYGLNPVVTLLGTAQTKVYGNIMSLLDEDNFATLTALPNQGYVFYGLFRNNANLTDASGLLLPATTLANQCYYVMFYGCSSLTAAPALPATTLAQGCYNSMFQNCSTLTAAPVLPATTLAQGCYNSMFKNCSTLTAAPVLPADSMVNSCYSNMFNGCSSLTAAPALPSTTLALNCYYQMFYGCSSLTSAPVLPAQTLVGYCYYQMFYGCSSLTAAPALPATTLANHCYRQMFQNCSSLTAAPALPATTLANYCYQSMFQGCEALTAAPALPATTLANQCYRQMFQGCSNLNSVTCLATDISANQCTTNWLDGVAATGTFTTPASTNWSTGATGIPTGWTRIDPNEVPLTMEALTAGNIQVYIDGTLSTGMKYSVNGGAKNLITTTTTIDVAAGDKVQFFGNGTSTQVYGGIPEVKLLGTAQTKVYGNIMSLLDEDNFATLTALPSQDYVFYGLFKNNATLTDASGLLLPATTLAEDCYSFMFYDCSSLTAAPVLPATTLASNCYYAMFQGCGSLTAAPALPATTLAGSCYYGMFYGCSSLTAAPALPATTLANSCYRQMFQNCSNLNSVTCLATTINASLCTNDWLLNVAATGTFITPASTNWSTGATGIPNGWTRQTP